MHVDRNPEKLKLIKIFLGGRGQKWVCPAWSWDSNTDFILRMNRWNKLIFCMLAKI